MDIHVSPEVSAALSAGLAPGGMLTLIVGFIVWSLRQYYVGKLREQSARVQRVIEEEKRKTAQAEATAKTMILEATAKADTAVNVGKQLVKMTEILSETLERQSSETKRIADERHADNQLVAGKIDTNIEAIRRLETDLEGVRATIDAVHLEMKSLPDIIVQQMEPAKKAISDINHLLSTLATSIRDLASQMNDIATAHRKFLAEASATTPPTPPQPPTPSIQENTPS